MGLIAYPPVYDAKRVTPLRKVYPRARQKCVSVDPVLRAKNLREQANLHGLKVFRERGTPDAIREIIAKVAENRDVSVMLIASDSRKRIAVWARNEAMYLIKQSRPNLSMPRIAKWFDRDHTSAQHGIASHADLAGLPKLVGYNLDIVKARNMRIAAKARAAAKATNNAL